MIQPPKLLCVIPTLSSYLAFLSELGEQLLSDGAEVHVVCGQPLHEAAATTENAVAGLHVHYIEMPRGLSPAAHMRAAKHLRQLVRRIAPTVIHAHFSAAIFTTALAREKSWPPLLATFQGLSFPLIRGLKKIPVMCAEIWSSRRCDAVWVLTTDDLAALRRGCDAKKIHLQKSPGFGCVVAKFDCRRFSAADRLERRQSLGLAASDFVFVFVGRWVEFKGFGLAVKAFAQIREDHPRAKLLLIGSYDSMHPSGLTNAEQQALAANTQIVDAGWQTDVSPYLASSDVMVFPSEREGMPVCVMEARSMGLPVITADSRGCRELIENEVDGLVVERTVPAVAEALNRFLSDPAAVTTMSLPAPECETRYDRRQFIREQISIYESYQQRVAPS